jgi:hypothetical protein
MSTAERTTDVLTISQAGYLADLIAGVSAGKRMRYYPMGSKDADRPMVQVLRAFTHEGGALYDYHADIRDAHVWTSGLMEHWFPVRDLLAAMSNAIDPIDLDAPMAMIEEAQS